MLLYLTSRDQNGDHREFYCQLDKLEIAFEFLSDIVAKGSRLSRAFIHEDGKQTELPIVVFDGAPFLSAMQELEKDWQLLLNEPSISATPIDDQLISLIQERARQFETRIASYKEMISRLEQLLERTHENFSPSPIKTRVVDQYEFMIDRNQVWLIKAQVTHNIILQRLTQLLK